MEPDAVADLFHVFDKRYDVLDCLCDGELDKRAIEDRIDASRPTIDRAFRELEAHGLLTSAGTAYELTNFGELCCSEFARTQDALDTLTDVEDVLSYLPRDAGLDFGLLDGANVVHAEEHAPQEPFQEILGVVTDASEVAGYSSTIMPHYVDSFHSLVVDAGIPTRLVFTEDVVDTGYANYGETFTELVEADNATIYATSHVYTYGVAIGDGTVAVPVGDELDRLQAVIVNDTDAAVAWGRDFVDRVIESERTRRVS